MGHLGGLLIGFSSGFAFARPVREALPRGNYGAENGGRTGRMRVIGVAATCVLFGGGFALFFGVRSPKSFVFGC